VVAFLHPLLRHIRRRPILLFWDNGPHHRSRLVQGFLREHPRIEAHRRPGYSPELNPDEWVWARLKKHELASYAPRDVGELRDGLGHAGMRIRVRPELIRSFFRASDLPN
jgi:transposase